MTTTPKKPRRARVDSATGIAAAIVAGGKTITLPAGTTMDIDQRRVFAELADEFSKSELSAHKIRLLVMLAKQMVMLDREQVTLANEGVSLVNSHGNAFPNPRLKACSGLTAAILAMRRSLGIHTRAQAGGDNREAAKRRSHNKAHEGQFEDEDGLLPRPNVIQLHPDEDDDDDR